MIILDTSTLICYLEKQVGYTLLNKQCQDKQNEISILNSIFSERRISLINSIARQIELNLYNFNTRRRNKKKDKVTAGDKERIMRNLTSILKNSSIFEYPSWDKYLQKEYLQALCVYQQKCIDAWNQQPLHDPYKTQSFDWLKKKKRNIYNKYHMNKISNENIKKILKELSDDANNGFDNDMLAKSTALTKDHIVFFISNDGDHITFDSYIRAITNAKMWVMHPCNVKQNIDLLQQLVYQPNTIHNDDPITNVLRVLNILQKEGAQNKFMIKRYMKSLGWPTSDFITDLDNAEKQELIIKTGKKDMFGKDLFKVSKYTTLR